MTKLIVEMEMPISCRACPILDESGDYPICKITQETKGYTFDTRNKKMDKCPIKGVLPEEHGDLIDRSLLCADLIGVILSHSRLDVGEVIARQNAVIAAESNGLREIEKAWGQYIEREKVAEKIAVEEELNRRRRELEELKRELKELKGEE